MKLKKQQGAVMLETAYVLPLVLTAVLLIVEIIVLALNTFAASDVLYELHSDLVNDVSSVSENGTAAGYASCSGGSVVLNKGLIENGVTNDVIARFKLLSSKSESNVTGSTSVKLTKDSTLDFYVITFTGTAPAVVLPGFFSELLPIKVNAIISVNESCTMPP
jgi:hypothetical protein